jgi:hypothetical protein
MLVGISEAGQYRVAAQINHARVSADVFLHGGIRANENDAIRFDGDRFGLWRFVVRGVDVAIFEDDVGWSNARLKRHEAHEQRVQYD